MRTELAVKNLKEVKEVLDRLGIEYWLDWGTLLGAVREGKIIEWDHDIDLGVKEDDWEKFISALPEFEKRGFCYWCDDFKIRGNFLKRVVDLCRFEHYISIAPYRIINKKAFYVIEGFEQGLFLQGLKWLHYLLLSQKPYVKPKWKPLVKIVKSVLSLLPSRSKKYLSNAVIRAWVEIGHTFFLTVSPKHYFENLGTIKFCGMTFNIPSNVEDYLELHYGRDWKTPKKKWNLLKDDGTIRKLSNAGG